MDRREALRRIGLSAVAPVVAGFHPWVPRQEGGWRPRFLESDEVEAVMDLSERIIPETDTPGARRANVHQYVDYVLSQGASPSRERFREGLRLLDGRSRSAHRKRFVELGPHQQDEILERLSAAAPDEDPRAVAFFQQAKQLTVEGYYRSEVGMREELGYEGNSYLAEFEGCAHEEHRSWKAGE